MSINAKVNPLVWLEFELSYDVAVQQVSHYTLKITPFCIYIKLSAQINSKIIKELMDFDLVLDLFN